VHTGAIGADLGSKRVLSIVGGGACAHRCDCYDSCCRSVLSIVEGGFRRALQCDCYGSCCRGVLSFVGGGLSRAHRCDCG